MQIALIITASFLIWSSRIVPRATQSTSVLLYLLEDSNWMPLSSLNRYPPHPMCVGAHVHVYCIHVHTSKHTHTYVYEGQTLTVGIFLNLSPPYSSKTEYLTELRAHRFGQTSWPVSSKDPPISVSQHWKCASLYLFLCMDCSRDLYSSSLTCKESTLLTQSSLRSP